MKESNSDKHEVIQLGGKFASYGTGRLLPLAPLPSQLDLVHIVALCFSKCCFDIIATTFISHKLVYCLSGFPAEIFYAFLAAPIHSTCSARLLPRNFKEV
jgi:hypothetical protein